MCLNIQAPSFLPCSPSFSTICKLKGDCLKADEEGERFDAGAEATWATRKHHSFMIHTVAAAAARATYRAAAAESKRRRLAAPLPASIKQCAFQFQRIHAPCHRARRNAEMRHLLPNTVC